MKSKTERSLAFECPKCGASRSRACRSERTPGANTLGGGWGGPSPLSRSHRERFALVDEADEAEVAAFADAILGRPL